INDIEVRMFGEYYECDCLGKTSGHPVFLTLGNISTWLQNSADSKVLLGFLPKVQGTMIKTTNAFRIFQYKTYQKCLKTMLDPLLKRPDKLYFGIQEWVVRFAACISVFIAYILKVDEITATYKTANSKMPCYSCLVQQRKEYSVYNVENAFWEFPNFDDHLRHIPHFLELKLFSKLGQLKIMTAADYRNLMKVKSNELVPTVSKVICHKTEGFGKILYELKLNAIETRVNFLKSSNQTHPNFIEELSQLIPALNAFLDMSLQDS
ncbi:13240_t:CDS:2, partial [Dentiscutata heterogama]